jgi:hypothetical protein
MTKEEERAGGGGGLRDRTWLVRVRAQNGQKGTQGQSDNGGGISRRTHTARTPTLLYVDACGVGELCQGA